MPFKPSLFRGAIRAGAALQPVSFSYFANAELRQRVAFLGDQGLLENLWGLLGLPVIPVTVRFMPMLPSTTAVTRTLAGSAWEAVVQGSEQFAQPSKSSKAA